MERKRDGLISISDIPFDMPGQKRHYFTRLDQVDQLVGASEADADMGFMARLMMLCSLPRTNPGDQREYIRRNGPFKLGITAGIDYKLPYGNLPRLLLAWVCTEAVRTQSRDLVLGDSLSEFMRKLGIYSTSGGEHTRLRNQMKRLFHSHVQLVYEDETGGRFVSSQIADSGEFWWNPKRPNDRTLWKSKIELGEKFFHEIITSSVPLDMNILKALKRSPLGLDLYLWLTYRTFSLKRPLWLTWPQLYRQVRSGPGQGGRYAHRGQLPHGLPAGVEEDQDRLAGTELPDGQGGDDRLALDTRYPTDAQAAPAYRIAGSRPRSRREVGL